MLLLLTRREVCKDALLEVMAAMPGRRPEQQRLKVVASFAEAQRAPPDHTALVIDLASLTASGDDVIASVHRLLASRPWLSVVLLTSHDDPDLEADVIYGLRHLASMSIVQPRELHDVRRWQSLFDDQFAERHATKIEADLRHACGDSEQARFFDDPEVKRLLRLAARIGKVEDLPAPAAGRVGVWRWFKRHWGRTPSEMLSVFRLVWAVHLHQEGFKSADVAYLLGFQDAQHCARSLGTRLHLRKSEINALDYQRFVSSVVECLTRGTPLSALEAAVRRSV